MQKSEPKDETPQEEETFDDPEEFRKLFIGGLALNTTDDSLKDYMSKFGRIVDIIVMKDGVTKRCLILLRFS